MNAPLRVAVLGSTGSIGRQALDVAARFPERVRIVALAANRSGALLAEQARLFDVTDLAVADPTCAPCGDDLPRGAECATGAAAVVALAVHPDADVVLNALVGAAGLRASEAALVAGKRLALANKESLVVGGELLMALAGGAATTVSADTRLIPVDSEHSAIFQCLVGEPRAAVARIWLTASGGPFRGHSRAQLDTVTREAALAHPRWTMGPKITVDSATLMNKGLEAIEAHHLFGTGYDAIRVVVHPQSVVHSMVEFVDGSVKAHLGATDMRVPIQYALSHPDRWDAPCEPVDFVTLGHLDFEEPDPVTFRCLALALEAGRTGGTLPAAMNAANEVAVAAFLEGRLPFTGIDRVVATVMEAHDTQPVSSFDQLEMVDSWARDSARLLY
ncbi:MAG: 1-deoxy-D-xylulose-5-phosphate reductoisomerase [Coriobacteriia bacterium]|nr:1-deoxy-D-xylulose-5-phosphate reductoisomerase [Coriobacteriia bacterium]